MLQGGTKHSDPSVNAQSQRMCSSQVKEEQPTLTLEPISQLKPVSFGLAKDLESCLDQCIGTLDKHGLNLSLLTLDLNSFDRMNTLKIAPGNINFIKLMTFDADNFRISGISIMKPTNLLNEDLKHNELFIMRDINLINGTKVDEAFVPAEVPQKYVPFTTRVLHKICGNRLQYVRGANSLCGYANRMVIKMRSDIIMKSQMPSKRLFDIDQLKRAAFLSDQSSSVAKPLSLQLGPLFSTLFQYMKKLFNFQDNEKATNEILKCNDSGAFGDAEKEPTTKEVSRFLSKINELGMINVPILNQDADIKTKTMKMLKLLELSLLIGTGIHMFYKPAKILSFHFPNLCSEGKGHVEIWKQSKSGNCYFLLWDEDSSDVLLRMRIDEKCTINYLGKSTISCGWEHHNYAKLADGNQQSLSCCFDDSETADEFVRIVATCKAQSQQLCSSGI